MAGLNLGGMVETRGRDDLRQCFHRIAVKMVNALRFVRHHQGPLTLLVLSRDSDRAAIRMAGSGLDTAHREHEAPRRVAPVSAHGHGASSERVNVSELALRVSRLEAEVAELKEQLKTSRE